MRRRRRSDRAGRRRSSPAQLLDYWLNGRPDRRLGLSMLEQFERLLLTQQTRLPRPQPRLLLIAWVPSRKNFLETPRAATTIALANSTLGAGRLSATVPPERTLPRSHEVRQGR